MLSLENILSGILGAFSVGLPLWIKLQWSLQKLKGGAIELDAKAHDAQVKQKIDSEAEWKRIIEFRDAELQRLRDRDDQQDKQLRDLFDKHTECRANEAKQGEQIKQLQHKINNMETGRIDSMREIAELRATVNILTKGALPNVAIPTKPPDGSDHSGDQLPPGDGQGQGKAGSC